MVSKLLELIIKEPYSLYDIEKLYATIQSQIGIVCDFSISRNTSWSAKNDNHVRLKVKTNHSVSKGEMTPSITVSNAALVKKMEPKPLITA